MTSAEELGRAAGVTWFDYQAATFDAEAAQEGPAQKALLFYRTGAGKSLTALTLIRLWGHEAVLVIAPPSTHSSWVEAGLRLGVRVRCVSHQKFRQGTFLLDRDEPVIADEFHQFGGHTGQGWKKLERLARGIKAPMVLASATPNYNDAERVYCIQKILNPQSVKGGYIEFLYRHCETEQNPFGQEPKVLGFWRFASATEYLASLDHVYHVPSEVEYEIHDHNVYVDMPAGFDRLNFNARRKRIMASDIEKRHARVNLGLIDDDGFFREELYDKLISLTANVTTPMLLYCDHSTVAEALAKRLQKNKVEFRLVTGKTSPADKERHIQEFRSGRLEVLVGTASLATGTDGLDKVCDTLVIVDDTDDDAKREQLVGRILPRGADSDASRKMIARFILNPE